MYPCKGKGFWAELGWAVNGLKHHRHRQLTQLGGHPVTCHVCQLGRMGGDRKTWEEVDSLHPLQQGNENKKRCLWESPTSADAVPLSCWSI